jgi:hypothetical protein
MEFTGSAPPSGQSQDAATQAREKASEVSGQTQEKAQEVAGKARDRVQQEVDQRSTQAGEQISGTASDLRGVGEELRNRGNDTGARVADQAAQRADRVGSYLKESDGQKLLDDVEELGRRQPLVVLAGGLVLGFAAARFLKASSHQRYQSRSATTQPTSELAGTGTTAQSYGRPNPAGPGYGDGMGSTPDPGTESGAAADVAEPRPSTGVPAV